MLLRDQGMELERKCTADFSAKENEKFSFHFIKRVSLESQLEINVLKKVYLEKV